MRRTILRALLGPLSAVLLMLSLGRARSTASQTGFDTLSKRAAEALRADHPDEAVLLYKNALALRPDWVAGWSSLGRIEYERHNYKAAREAFGHVLQLFPNDGDATVLMGLCEFELRQNEKALQHLEHGKQLGVSDPNLRSATTYHEGLLLLRAGSFKSAQISLSSLCRVGMQSAEVLENIGLSYLRILPKDSPPAGTPAANIVQRVGHAACLAAQKQFDNAREEYRALEQEHPEYPYLHYAAGRFRADMDDVPAAVAEFRQELNNQPNDINSRLEIAAAEYKLDSAAALPYAEEAVKLNPLVPSAHYLLGLLYLDTDNYEKAIPELETARRALPKDAKICFALGSAYARAGRKEDAARARAAFAQLNKESETSSEFRH
jgi:tetratricopeptide (TPR) repeat protein